MTFRETAGAVVGALVVVGFVWLSFGFWPAYLVLAFGFLTSQAVWALTGFGRRPLRLPPPRPSASISDPNAGQLAAGARDGRRHAEEVDT